MAIVIKIPLKNGHWIMTVRLRQSLSIRFRATESTPDCRTPNVMKTRERILELVPGLIMVSRKKKYGQQPTTLINLTTPTIVY